jgi:hypothetical protein
MGSHMKTTIEISDAVLDDARKVARREGTTLRALVEHGLRQVIAQHRRKSAFRLRDASAGSGGLRPELEGAAWNRLRELAYEGRGG